MSIATLEKLRDQSSIIDNIAKKLDDTRKTDGVIYIIGNGGSASTATHMASDLLKSAIKPGKKRFKAISLSDNVPVMLAWANDSSYEVIFEEQLRNFLTDKDVLIAISGSGNSKNILKAVDFANKTGAYTIGLTGMGGGQLAKIAKLSLVIQDASMDRTEDLHLMLDHILVYSLNGHQDKD